jgi:uncharacterized protein
MTRDTRNLMLAGAGVAAATALYAFYVEPRWLKRTYTRLHFRTLPPALEGVRIVLLTDMHVGRRTPASLLPRVDAHDDGRAAAHDRGHGRPGRVGCGALPAVLDWLSALHAPLGVHVVPGNHDHRMGIGRWHEAVRAHPALTDLTNRAVMMNVPQDGADDARLCIAGVDDLSEGEPNLDMLPPPESRDFTILLAHQPDQAERVRRTAPTTSNLVLSGHTHAGQVRLPWVGAIVNSARQSGPVRGRRAAPAVDAGLHLRRHRHDPPARAVHGAARDLAADADRRAATAGPSAAPGRCRAATPAGRRAVASAASRLVALFVECDVEAAMPDVVQAFPPARAVQRVEELLGRQLVDAARELRTKFPAGLVPEHRAALRPGRLRHIPALSSRVRHDPLRHVAPPARVGSPHSVGNMPATNIAAAA